MIRSIIHAVICCMMSTEVWGRAGNLKLTKRLFDDIRFIQPEAWVDWQYMEENNDQYER